MKILWVTWVLVAAVVVRLISALFRLGADLNEVAAIPVGPYFPNVAPTAMARVAAWALHELPQTLIYIVDIMVVQGLYTVWFRLRRSRLKMEKS